jgi:hypothetical protein
MDAHVESAARNRVRCPPGAALAHSPFSSRSTPSNLVPPPPPLVQATGPPIPAPIPAIFQCPLLSPRALPTPILPCPIRHPIILSTGSLSLLPTTLLPPHSQPPASAIHTIAAVRPSRLVRNPQNLWAYLSLSSHPPIPKAISTLETRTQSVAVPCGLLRENLTFPLPRSKSLISQPPRLRVLRLNSVSTHLCSKWRSRLFIFIFILMFS